MKRTAKWVHLLRWENHTACGWFGIADMKTVTEPGRVTCPHCKRSFGYLRATGAL